MIAFGDAGAGDAHVGTYEGEAHPGEDVEEDGEAGAGDDGLGDPLGCEAEGFEYVGACVRDALWIGFAAWKRTIVEGVVEFIAAKATEDVVLHY